MTENDERSNRIPRFNDEVEQSLRWKIIHENFIMIMPACRCVRVCVLARKCCEKSTYSKNIRV